MEVRDRGKGTFCAVREACEAVADLIIGTGAGDVGSHRSLPRMSCSASRILQKIFDFGVQFAGHLQGIRIWKAAVSLLLTSDHTKYGWRKRIRDYSVRIKKCVDEDKHENSCKLVRGLMGRFDNLFLRYPFVVRGVIRTDLRSRYTTKNWRTAINSGPAHFPRSCSNRPIPASSNCMAPASAPRISNAGVACL
jgi:hypothetical protein